MDELQQLLLSKEEALVHHDFKNHVDQLEALIAPDFEEQDADGKLVGRKEVIQWILTKPEDYRWEFDQPSIKKLSDTMVMLSYRSRQLVPLKKSSPGSLRSSIWKLDPEIDNWQLVYHQVVKFKKG